jgi:flavin-dependent dehydrogenase
MDMDVVIVGGGLGGLALAVGLRERGIKAQVYERAAEHRHNIGTAISIGHNGVYTLSPSPPPICTKNLVLLRELDVVTDLDQRGTSIFVL